MNDQPKTWYDIGPISRVATLVDAALENAARGLSDFVGRPITTGTTQARVVRLNELSAGVGHPESETVGIYLLMKGDLSGQAILLLPLSGALNLTDLLMEAPPGTSTTLGDMERSALGEVGNLTVSYFVNAMAALTGRPLRPSAPAVMVDMLGAILDVPATLASAVSDELMIIETILQDDRGLVQAHFWVLPDLVSQISKAQEREE